MHTYDISVSISPELPVWPGDPPVKRELVEKIDEGANANVSRVDMGVHTGTHVDAPFHFLGGDTPTVESLPLRILTGRTYVLHLPDDVDVITGEILTRSDIPPRTRRLLLKTRNSRYWESEKHEFQTGFVGLSEDGARYLVNRGVKLVGIDYLSIAPYKHSRPTHEVLLKAGVIIVEGLDLSKVTQGRYTLYCLPLKLVGSDGAPARAILVGV